MDLGIKDKTILVTGGSKGIGRAICRAFLAEGARVGFCARNSDQIAATEAELGSLGTITGTSLDVSDSTAVADWVAAMTSKYGGVDGVVANASALSIGVAMENWKSGYDIDLMGTQNLVNAATFALIEAAQRHGDASFTMITSTAAAEAPFANAYGAIKAAMIHLTKGLARQHAAQGVRFNSVSPGTVYSDGGTWGQIEKAMPDLFKQTLARNPTGRMATPEDVASAVVFLSCPRSSFTTGINMLIDGALTQRVNY